MPTYRVYYAERQVGPQGGPRPIAVTRLGRDYTSETEWEDQIEAPDVQGALDQFFKEHVGNNSELAWVDDDGQGHPLSGLDYDPDKTYIWVEPGPEPNAVSSALPLIAGAAPSALPSGDRYMEFQGVDEATPGMMTCPLCNGHTEIEQELANNFQKAWNEHLNAAETEDQRADVAG